MLTEKKNKHNAKTSEYCTDLLIEFNASDIKCLNNLFDMDCPFNRKYDSTAIFYKWLSSVQFTYRYYVKLIQTFDKKKIKALSTEDSGVFVWHQ